MQRYFLEEDYQGAQQYRLTGEPFHHMIHVMRMKPGTEVYLAFQNQLAIVAEITAVSDEAVELQEVRKETQNKELPVAITIASGYPKGDKLEWIVQKGTELGAHAFIGFPAKSSVVKWDGKKLGKKQQRLGKIAQEAAEQSHRQVTPQIDLLENLGQFQQRLTEFDVILVAYEEAAKEGEQANLVQVFKKLPQGARVLAVFGPEGGILPAEVDLLTAAGGIFCGLGPRILRTETAPLYLLSAASFYFELEGGERRSENE